MDNMMRLETAITRQEESTHTKRQAYLSLGLAWTLQTAEPNYSKFKLITI